MIEVAEFLQEFSSDGLVLEIASDFVGYIHSLDRGNARLNRPKNRRPPFWRSYLEASRGLSEAEREEIARHTCYNLICEGIEPNEAEEEVEALKFLGAYGMFEARLADYRAALDEGLRRYKEYTFSDERWEDGGAPSLSDWYKTAPMM
jgi:hypothetical protein